MKNYGRIRPRVMNTKINENWTQGDEYIENSLQGPHPNYVLKKSLRGPIMYNVIRTTLKTHTIPTTLKTHNSDHPQNPMCTLFLLRSRSK